MSILFELGQLTATAGVANFMQEDPAFAKFVWDSLSRYVTGDWGEMEQEDLDMNDDAVHNEGRIHASYPIPRDIHIDWAEKIWIITEWDRSYTTILFPDEY